MSTIPKIKASLYAIEKRLNGYHLLRNPKGTSQTEVNMVKENLYGVSVYMDDIFHINRIKTTFSENGMEKETRLLMSTHFFDGKEMQMTKPRKKDILFSVRKNNEYVNMSEKHDLGWEQSNKRATIKLSHRRSNIFKYDSEYDRMYRKKQEAQINRGYYKRHYSVLSKILSIGMYKKISSPQENRPNFFKILYQNLTNK